MTLLALPILSGAAIAQSLVNGGSVGGTISSSGQKRSHSFTALAGESFQIRVVDVNSTRFYPTVKLYDPSGVLLSSDGDHDVAALGRSAPRTGTYRVVVTDGNITPGTGVYRVYFTLAPGANEGGALPNGGAASGRIDRGDLDSYTFAIAAGESYQIRLADSNATGLYVRVLLYDPSGAFVHQDADHNVAALGGAATRTGTYTVVVCDGNISPTRTGSYKLHFARVPGANAGGTLPNGGIVAGSIRLGELDSYTFSITAGQSYLLRLTDTNATPLYIRVLLYDPRGCFVVQDADHNVAALGGVAKFTGIYTVVVCDGNTSPAQTGDYKVHLVRAPGANAGGSLPSGGSVAGRIELGELDSYTFDIDAGQSYQLRLADSQATPLYIRVLLYDPRGCFVAQDADHNVAALGGVAKFTGTYTVVATDGNTSPAQTGDYRLHFARVPSANAGGSLRSGAITGKIELGEIDSFTFTMNAGARYILRLVDSLSTGLYPRVLLYDPRGTFVAQASAHTVASLSGAAAFTGRYTVLLTDGNTSPARTGDYKLHFTRIPEANEGGFLLNGVSANQDIELGDLDAYTFRARAGDTVKIILTDKQAGSLYPALSLFSPRGTYIKRASGHTTAVLNQVITRDGTHTIVVYDGNSAPTGTGPYSIAITGSGYVGNSGCDREGPSLVSGTISARTGFTFTAPTFTRSCSGPKIVLFGSCAPQPVLLPPSISCGSCGLVVTSVWGSGLNQVTIPPLPSSTVGLSFCVQSGCTAGGCITLSAGLRLTIEK